MAGHNDFLTTIGMVVNVAKIELIYFARKWNPITVSNLTINPREHLKVLGVLFGPELSWGVQVGKVVSK